MFIHMYKYIQIYLYLCVRLLGRDITHLDTNQQYHPSSLNISIKSTMGVILPWGSKSLAPSCTSTGPSNMKCSPSSFPCDGCWTYFQCHLISLCARGETCHWPSHWSLSIPVHIKAGTLCQVSSRISISHLKYSIESDWIIWAFFFSCCLVPPPPCFYSS